MSYKELYYGIRAELSVANKELAKLRARTPRVVSSGPLSSSAAYRLEVSGPFDIKERERLIAALRLTKEFMEARDDERVTESMDNGNPQG